MKEARAARRAKQPLSSVEGPMLCVITPSMSSEHAEEAGATRISEGSPGLYKLAPMFRTMIVVVNELPDDSSTLWLRLLGRGAVQAGAVRQLAALSEQEPLRDATFRLLVAWQHAVLQWDGARWWVRDLGSTNGTQAGGRRLASNERAPLETGAVLVFGTDEERWTLEEDGPPTASARGGDGRGAHRGGRPPRATRRG